MKNLKIWLHALISVFITIEYTLQDRPFQKSLLAYKGSPKHVIPIAADTDNFLDLVHNSDVFVDKTIIIEKILLMDGFNTILLSLPKTWGKSINLHMLKTFVELQLDENGNKITPHNTTSTYRLFKNSEIITANGEVESLQEPLHISKRHAVFNNFQGKYPVIYLQLGGINATDYDDFLEIMNIKIMDIFKQHLYITASPYLGKNAPEPYYRNRSQVYLDLFTKIIENRSTEYDLTISLPVLSEMLCKHHNQQVFLLMDDWDSVLCNFLFEESVSQSEAQRIFNFYSDFMTNAFKTNAHLHKGIFTGTFRGIKLIPALENIKEYYGPQSIFYELYGFNKAEVNALFNHFNISINMQLKANDWYGGYNIQPQSKKYLCNPRSISNFVCDKRIRNYRIQRDHYTNHMLKNIFQDNEARNNFLAIILNLGFTWVHYHELRPKYMLAFKEILCSKNSQKLIQYFEWNDISSYLYDAGYFKSISNLGYAGVQMRIANYEVKNELLTVLMDDYKADYGISSIDLDNAMHCMAKLFLNFNITENDFIDSLQFLLNFSPRYIMPFIVQYLASRVTMEYDFNSKGMPKEFACDTCRPDDILYTKEREIIIKTIVESSVMDDIKEHVHHYRNEVENSKSYRVITFVGITITANRTVKLYIEFPSKSMNGSEATIRHQSTPKSSPLVSLGFSETTLLENQDSLGNSSVKMSSTYNDTTPNTT